MLVCLEWNQERLKYSWSHDAVPPIRRQLRLLSSAGSVSAGSATVVWCLERTTRSLTYDPPTFIQYSATWPAQINYEQPIIELADVLKVQ